MLEDEVDRADPGPGVLILTGAMAAGKSTVAELVARTSALGVHLRGDLFRRAIVSGGLEPSPDMPAQAWDQLRLRYRIAATVADRYAAAGFFTVLQDVVVGAVLSEVVEAVATRPRYVVVLDPDPEVVAARAAARAKVGYGAGFEPHAFVDALRSTTPRLGLWVDSSRQTPEQTAATIRERLADAVV